MRSPLLSTARLFPVLALAALLSVTVASELAAQARIPPRANTVSLGGPRFGVTILSEGITDYLQAEHDIELSAMITQFGWQFERQFYSIENGPTAVTEWVLLVGGLEQGEFLPSLSWLVGVRTPRGVEFGVGPNITPAGSALAIAAGFTTRFGVLNVPVNVAVVPSGRGTRLSLLSGFATRR